MHGLGSRGNPDPLCPAHPETGGGVTRSKKQEPSLLKDHLHAKFQPNLSSSVDFYR